ncbi:FtsX-like permease family protein [Chitinophaga sp. Cy-1792]|uniref:ABC transporter permease n=1 Tax=Chitinophaga sp. Cy-1792 TaxID=2608339 RepID=UPI0014246CA1|nr:FtsX-like permease family protein [Chitinophaga sp. Cy-1792]NIG56400.1 ABC transporter permease [Chitinophaga sp. Cy-1792]
MKRNINTEIAFTYLTSRPKQTIVAALGVTFGISMFIFMNSLIKGTNDWSEKIMLNSTPHLRLYHDNEMSSPDMLNKYLGKKTYNLISNPQLVYSDNRITNPDAVMQQLRSWPEVTAISKQVSANVIYSSGNVQENGSVYGISVAEQDKMFDITSTMISGTVRDLQDNQQGIMIGSGLAEKLNLKKGDYITLTASNGIRKRLTVTGIFKTTIKAVDNTKSYANIAISQQLLQKDRSYITDIYINIKDHKQTKDIAAAMQARTGYTVETWQTSNQQALAGQIIRNVIANAMVITILVVAGFGIYNILNMVIYEKIKEIAILKATGFQGAHVTGIFIRQALLIGLIGVITGMLFGWLISLAVSRIYLGLGSVAYLPMAFEWPIYFQGGLFGIVTAFFAGYIPALKASKVDPVQIIRG